MMSDEQWSTVVNSSIAYSRAINELSNTRYIIASHRRHSNKIIPMRLVSRELKAQQQLRTLRAAYFRHVFNAEIL